MSRTINNHSCALIIFTREPESGATKTRLMPYFNGEQCRDLHRCMLKDIRRAAVKSRADIIVSYTGGDPVFLRKTFGKRDCLYIRQRGEGLGQRMENAMSAAFGMGYGKVILIGTDIPELETESLEDAFAKLDVADAVIGPTEDGGYWLIGMKALHHEAFDLEEYSTGTVFERTVLNLEKAGIITTAADMYSDIDTPEDIAAFRSRMREDAYLRRSDTGRFIAANAQLSVIIPVYNEASTVSGLIDQLSETEDRYEVIFVDGGSTDDTLKIINEKLSSTGNPDMKLLHSRKGRGVQLNTGAMASSGDILFFLHCDSILPRNYLKEIRRIMAEYEWGCFGIRFRSHNFFMFTNRIISNHRAAFRNLPFGDQGIFMDRRLFFECGMYPEIPVMEDYALSLRLRRYGYRPGMTRSRILTSSRRYGSGTRNIIRTEITMWKLRCLYRKGSDPGELEKRYLDIR